MSSWLKKHLSKDHSKDQKSGKPPKGGAPAQKPLPSTSFASKDEAIRKVRNTGTANPWSVQSKKFERNDDDWESFFTKKKEDESDSDESSGSQVATGATDLPNQRSVTPPPTNRTRATTQEAVWRSPSMDTYHTNDRYGSPTGEKQEKKSKKKGKKGSTTQDDSETKHHEVEEPQKPREHGHYNPQNSGLGYYF